MLFTEELRNHVGELVQVVTAVEIVAYFVICDRRGSKCSYFSFLWTTGRCSCTYSYHFLCSLGRVSVVQV